MIAYNKLVRDKIPDIITSKGDIATTRILSEDEYMACLRQKLCEEVNEFLKDETIEELADIYEVILAILEQKGVDFAAFQEIRNAKLLERGNFSGKIFLESVIRKNEKQ